MFPVMSFIMENGNKIEIELRVDKSENAIYGLIEAVLKHAYDHMQIQRVVPGFVLQPWYDEARMSDFYQYVCDNEDTGLPFEKWTVGLAGDGDKISSPSSPFIVVGDCWQERLNGKFANVGKVISGFEEVERIMNVPLREVAGAGASVFEPITPEFIKTATIELNGFEVKECKKYLL